MQVIADTSFLMIPGMFGVDVVSELGRLLDRRYKLIIPNAVMRELERISRKGKPKEMIAARVGLLLAKRGSVVKSKCGADDEVLKLATDKRCVAGTTDAALRKKLRSQGVPVIYLRQRSHLAIDGWI